MSLDDIKKAILAEAEKEAEKIRVENENKIAAVKKEWQEKIDERKQEIIASAQRKANQKVQQTQFKLQAQAQTEILNQKQRLIDKVYKSALKKLTELSDDEYVELMTKLIDQLPKTDGKLISVKDKEGLLKKALKKSDKKYDLASEVIGGHGGFIFKSKEIEIDSTFASLVNNAEDQTILPVSNLLFNQPEN